MWLAKFKIWHETCLIRPLCVKYGITDLVYLLNSWTNSKGFFYTELHILQGPEESKKKFIREFKKDKSIVKFEKAGNYIITLNRKPSKEKIYEILFDSRLIYIKPVVQRSDGFEEWEIACWEKESLMKILNISYFKTEIKQIKQTKISDIFKSKP